MEYKIKDYGDGCVNFIITECDETKKYDLLVWCEKNLNQEFISGKKQDNPLVVTVESKNEKFIISYLKPTASTKTSKILK